MILKRKASYSIVVKRKETGMGGYSRTPIVVNKVIFDNKWTNELKVENCYDISNPFNYKPVYLSDDLRIYRYVFTDNDQLYIATENAQKHRYCIINNSRCDVKVVSSKDSVFIANNDSLVIVKKNSRRI